MRPAAVILDFDGVVVDSLAAHLKAWDEAVHEIFRQRLHHPERLAGHATRTIAQILAKSMGDPSLASALVQAKERHLAAGFATLPLLPGARAFTEAMAAAGVPFGIASNSTRGFVAGALAAAALLVPVVVSGDDVSRGKPEPDIFWECTNRLNVHPRDRGAVLVFEDSVHGLKAARAAGMLPVGVTTDQPEKRLRSAGAVAVCEHLAQALGQGWHLSFPAPEG